MEVIPWQTKKSAYVRRVRASSRRKTRITARAPSPKRNVQKTIGVTTIMKIKIKETANSKGISLYEVAKRAGFARQSIYSWANGRTQPSYENMDRLCSVLECTMDYLFEPEKFEIPTLEEQEDAIDMAYSFLHKSTEKEFSNFLLKLFNKRDITRLTKQELKILKQQFAQMTA